MTKKSPQKTPPKVSISTHTPKPTGGKPTPSPAVKKPTKVLPNTAASGTPAFVRPAATRELSRPTFKKGVITAEMRAAATGSAIAQDVLLALKYEGKPRHISDADYMKRFASYGWHDEEDDAAKEVLRVWGRQNTTNSADASLLSAAQFAIDSYERDEAQILQDMRDGLLTPSEARGSIQLLRQRTDNIRGALATFDGTDSQEEYETLVESVFGYNIELFNCGESSSDCIERNITQMRQLAASNLAIVDYIEAVAPGQGMYAFQNLFSENGQVNVFLQAENVVNLADRSGFSGLTPLGADNYNVYLGSQMTLGAITHEFFHQLDRAVERGRVSSVIAPGTSLSQYLDDNFVQQTQIPFNAHSIYEVGVYQTPPGQSVVQVITGYVGQVDAVGSSPELLADIGMTAVLSGTGEQVQVEVSDDSFEPYEVVWASTNNAATVQDYFNTLMGRLFGR